ncbi:MAG: cysteine dioxygenase family protein [Bacteroidota bacterium]
MNQSLQTLIDTIEHNYTPNFPNLTELITQIGLKREDFLEYNQFGHDVWDSYGRNKIYTGKNFTIFLMTWNPGDYTAIHSHGQCDWGAVLFFDEVSHRLYQVDGNEIHLVNKGTIPAGTIVAVNGGLVHSMGNNSNKPAITMHIYGSNISLSNANDDSRVYELEKKTISVTNGEAYFNLDPAKAKERVHGIISDSETISDYFTILLPFYKRIGDHDMTDFLEMVMENPECYQDQFSDALLKN